MHFAALISDIAQQQPLCLVFRRGEEAFSVERQRDRDLSRSDMNAFPGMPPLVRGTIDLSGAIVTGIIRRARPDDHYGDQALEILVQEPDIRDGNTRLKHLPSSAPALGETQAGCAAVPDRRWRHQQTACIR